MGVMNKMLELITGKGEETTFENILDLDKEFREIRQKVFYVATDNDIPLERKAEALEMTMGEYLEFMWRNDIMPHPNENKTMTACINEAIRESVDGKPIKEVAANLNISEHTAQMLITYRKRRRQKFFESAEQLQSVYELFQASWSDVDIAEALQIEPLYIALITDLLFKRKADVIGFVSSQ